MIIDPQTSLWLADLFFIGLGMAVGSFLNVCISRIPRGESVVLPASHCPICGAAIKPYDNIPVLSFLVLRGKCRSCKTPISWQYPLVEILTGLIFWLTWNRYGVSFKLVVFLLFFASLIVLVFIDLYHRILPDLITKSGLVAGLLFSMIAFVHDGTGDFLLSQLGARDYSPVWSSLLDSAIGAVICGGFLWGVAELYYLARKVEGLGFGDVKLMGMVGAFLGVKLGLFTILAGSFLGSVIGLAYIRFSGKDTRYELPFGSFLGVAAILAGLWGDAIVGGYLTVVRGH